MTDKKNEVEKEEVDYVMIDCPYCHEKDKFKGYGQGFSNDGGHYPIGQCTNENCRNNPKNHDRYLIQVDERELETIDKKSVFFILKKIKEQTNLDVTMQVTESETISETISETNIETKEAERECEAI